MVLKFMELTTNWELKFSMVVKNRGFWPNLYDYYQLENLIWNLPQLPYSTSAGNFPNKN